MPERSRWWWVGTALLMLMIGVFGVSVITNFDPQVHKAVIDVINVASGH